MSKPVIFLSNKQLLQEIHNSKITYCCFLDEKYKNYDIIVDSVDEITPKKAQEVIDQLNNQRKKAVGPIKSDPEEIVFRVMTYEHIPLCEDKKKRSRAALGEGHLRVNFPPFKHYVLQEGLPFEVGRSHWKNGIHNGEFSQDHGKINHRLARMFILLVERYGGRSNFRSYSYVDQMKSSALTQLSQVGLLFDESKGDNPFAFYTQCMKNSFVRIINEERKHQKIRDDLLIMNGAAPSHTRQIDNEFAQRAALEEEKKNQ